MLPLKRTQIRTLRRNHVNRIKFLSEKAKEKRSKRTKKRLVKLKIAGAIQNTESNYIETCVQKKQF